MDNQNIIVIIVIMALIMDRSMLPTGATTEIATTDKNLSTASPSTSRAVSAAPAIPYIVYVREADQRSETTYSGADHAQPYCRVDISVLLGVSSRSGGGGEQRHGIFGARDLIHGNTGGTHARGQPEGGRWYTSDAWASLKEQVLSHGTEAAAHAYPPGASSNNAAFSSDATGGSSSDHPQSMPQHTPLRQNLEAETSSMLPQSTHRPGNGEDSTVFPLLTMSGFYSTARRDGNTSAYHPTTGDGAGAGVDQRFPVVDPRLLQQIPYEPHQQRFGGLHGYNGGFVQPQQMQHQPDMPLHHGVPTHLSSGGYRSPWASLPASPGYAARRQPPQPPPAPVEKAKTTRQAPATPKRSRKALPNGSRARQPRKRPPAGPRASRNRTSKASETPVTGKTTTQPAVELDSYAPGEAAVAGQQTRLSRDIPNESDAILGNESFVRRVASPLSAGQEDNLVEQRLVDHVGTELDKSSIDPANEGLFLEPGLMLTGHTWFDTEENGHAGDGMMVVVDQSTPRAP
ncbi:uncharacterized protein B0I36DRAFT_363791 [Microdochium trichocladiopsis]|uniref:Uncharacterized protein n=1 Tax=Microdochium trichocladiopsis TaxID=1682393 RepID=A0A9P8Y552_9PEZI|nr:uncharacterized protein B0I36DRAFT_363791 [Microdochium trichocladiopsis]KAH7029220.1 hypothetical protein B0I36DRAFT_363791 [Microdochium trichocladiopsis]